jgi:hypothetical protein
MASLSINGVFVLSGVWGDKIHRDARGLVQRIWKQGRVTMGRVLCSVTNKQPSEMANGRQEEIEFLKIPGLTSEEISPYIPNIYSHVTLIVFVIKQHLSLFFLRSQ